MALTIPYHIQKIAIRAGRSRRTRHRKRVPRPLCYSYHHLYGIDISVLRYFTVYGPAGRPDMSIFRFVQWIRESRPVIIFGDGQQSRDFTYEELGRTL